MDPYLCRIHSEVLRGTLDPENPLTALRGNALIFRDIFDIVDKDWYERHIERTPHADSLRRTCRYPKVKFPQARGTNINMMPFKIFQRPYQLPAECLEYAPLINFCRAHLPPEEWELNPDRIAYLTITESAVPVGQTQRRPGLHVERPGAIVPGKGGRIISEDQPGHRGLVWGLGAWDMVGDHGIPTDGIFMASNLADTSMVWPVLIMSPEQVSDRHGGIERMRKHLGKGVPLPANTLCWITDRTPHESLPVSAPADNPAAQTVHRQFFRLVVGPISVWYSRHNTPNPYGIAPDATISDADKFAGV